MGKGHYIFAREDSIFVSLKVVSVPRGLCFLPIEKIYRVGVDLWLGEAPHTRVSRLDKLYLFACLGKTDKFSCVQPFATFRQPCS